MKPRREGQKRTPRVPSSGSGASAPLVTIEKPIYGGNFLARHEGQAIFVPMVLPGEQARVRIVEDKARRGYALAESEELVSVAPERVAPRCPHFGPCGGCNYQHTDYATQLKMKEQILRETLERAGVPPSSAIAMISGEQWAYRNRIRVAFDLAGNPAYRERRSNAMVAIRECPIAAPLLVRAALAAGEILQLVPPNLRPHELSLFCNAAESALACTFFARDQSAPRLEPLARALKEKCPELTGAELSAGGRPGHPPRTLEQWGAAFVTYRAAGFDYRVDHGAFFQVNRWLVDSLVNCVVGRRTAALAWDLFAGAGLFARALAARFEQVIAVESAEPAARSLAANLAATNGQAVAASTLDFLRGNATGPRPDLIVVDPPRTGLGVEITDLLAAIAAPAVVYVSCDPATLARDLRALRANYEIESMTLADLFPQTFHLETVVSLRHS